MRLVIVFSSLLAVVVTHPSLISEEEQWQMFKADFNKTYASYREEVYRKGLFMRTLQMIRDHNIKYERGESTYTMGVNQFTDMLHEEFNVNFADLKPSFTLKSRIRKVYRAKGLYIPQEVDWRKRGAVTEVKNQGNCGSCWAFAVTGSIEAQRFLATKQLVSLSEQNLIDCATECGCKGHWMDQTFEHIIRNKGIETASSYPYEAQDGHCRFNVSNVGATISSFLHISSGDEVALQEAVATLGPVSVDICTNDEFDFYQGGLFDDTTCKKGKDHHAVLLVGYGHDDQDGDYWLIKNSWGTLWGEKGYMTMTRKKKNPLRIADQAFLPRV